MCDREPLLLTQDAIEAVVAGWTEHFTAANARRIVGIAGIAASGKSTLAERLVHTANRHRPGVAALVPMDGFHLPNAQLESRGWKPRKGAAFTYDARAYVDLLMRYRDAAQIGGFPRYCRKVHEPIASRERITTSTQLIVTEGQYLLHTDKPWCELAAVLDECWWLDVPPEVAQQWLLKRDTAVGRNHEQAEAKYQNNDRLNTDFALAARRTPDRVVRWPKAS